MATGPTAIRYRGRFAPSPTGPLHAGSLVAALASWLDARAHGGEWLLRIEDVDTPRCVPGAEATILAQLAELGLVPDAPPIRQSARAGLYQHALIRLLSRDLAYPCGCTRAEIAQALAAAARDAGRGEEPGALRERHAELVYPGTCRDGLHGKPARAVRLRTAGAAPVEWTDRRLGAQRQDVEHAVGDFVLKRADGLWAYQLAVVVDDAAQQITHVVRGADLADNTPRQILLQRALGLPAPRYLHTPLVLGADGDKLSKQNGAEPLDARDPLAALDAAGRVLGLRVKGSDRDTWLTHAVTVWRAGWHDVGSIAASSTAPREPSP
ncbi:MAG TPA: tRNA glutamyl-Q(34) synthetase GluQRS [Burkholderiaceae bacterium]|jgi:glutamyl-Q tRNA(Asp) synthetase